MLEGNGWILMLSVTPTKKKRQEIQENVHIGIT